MEIHQARQMYNRSPTNIRCTHCLVHIFPGLHTHSATFSCCTLDDHATSHHQPHGCGAALR